VIKVVIAVDEIQVTKRWPAIIKAWITPVERCTFNLIM